MAFLIQSGVDSGMTLAQMLTYTFLGAVLSDFLVVHTQASSWLYERMFISLYQLKKAHFWLGRLKHKQAGINRSRRTAVTG